MANPTTNFGWVMPTSSSLVTNLPADFNTFGQAVDTSMSELLGGTTGQVLSKTSNTNMDFTWVTPTDQTPLTTKGDLFTFTTVDARLGVGTDGQTLVADSTAATGLKWATPSSGSTFNGCRVTQSAGLSLASGTSQIQLFDTEAFDTNSYHSTSTNTGRMTVPSTGYYLLSFNSSYSSNASGLRQTGIRKNGTVIQSATLSGSAVAQTDVVLSCILSATAGDYFDLELYQNSGTTLTVYGGTQSFFSISYLGA